MTTAKMQVPEPRVAAPDGRLPRVSVLVPVYNTRDYLLEAMQSISAQTFGDFELVVLDDGSTDGSHELLVGYCEREPRMRLVSRGNRGLIHTRNELVAAARGELVAWMDSDDLSAPDRLQIQVEMFDRDPALVCVSGNVECVDADGRLIGLEKYPAEHGQVVAEQAEGAGMRFGAAMMRAALVREVGGFREPFSIGEDLDLLLRLSEKGKVANSPRTLLRYRRYETSTSSRLGRRWVIYKDAILELARERRMCGSDKLQRGEPFVIDTSVVDVAPPAEETHALLARRAIRNGNRRAAWSHALEAVRTNMLSAQGWRVLLRVVIGTVRRG